MILIVEDRRAACLRSPVEPVHEWLRWKAERATRVDAGGEPHSGARADPGAPPLRAFSPRT
jgi:hypothetical protein